MRTVNGYEEIGQVFTNYFMTAQNTVFKLGVLQDYLDEDASPSWQAWAAGKKEESMQLILDDPRYADWIRAHGKSSAVFTRVQVVEYPLSLYAAWQLALFAEYQKYGIESVYFVDATHVREARIALPESDVVIFDNQRVLQWTYAPGSQGLVNGGTIWDVADGDDIDRFLTLRQAIMALAKPITSH